LEAAKIFANGLLSDSASLNRIAKIISEFISLVAAKNICITEVTKEYPLRVCTSFKSGKASLRFKVNKLLPVKLFLAAHSNTF
jgi:hypothetical protein